MGYALAMGSCFFCGSVFGFNPNKVPSLRGEPVCANCMGIINAKRKQAGMDELWVSPEAYEPCDENELG